MTFVETHRDTFGVAPLLAAIGEPVSTFYDRVGRKPSARAVADAPLAERVEAIWERSRRTYGAPRIHAMLARDPSGWAGTGGATDAAARHSGRSPAQTLENHPTGPR